MAAVFVLTLVVVRTTQPRGVRTELVGDLRRKAEICGALVCTARRNSNVALCVVKDCLQGRITTATGAQRRSQFFSSASSTFVRRPDAFLLPPR